MINNLEELFDHLGETLPDSLEEAEKTLSAHVYDDTSCGGWARFLRRPKPVRVYAEFEALCARTADNKPEVKSWRHDEGEWYTDFTHMPVEVREYLLLYGYPTSLVISPGDEESSFDWLTSTKPDSPSVRSLGLPHIVSVTPSNVPDLVVVRIGLQVDTQQGEPDKVYGLYMGTIVEGTDAEYTSQELYFPIEDMRLRDEMVIMDNWVDNYFTSDDDDEEETWETE